jgi:hypothetical protein
MGDGTATITRALKDFCTEAYVRLNCMFHVFQAIKRHVDPSLWPIIRADLKIIGASLSKSRFKKSVKLFFNKWRAVADGKSAIFKTSQQGPEEVKLVVDTERLKNVLEVLEKGYLNDHDGYMANWYFGCLPTNLKWVGSTNNGVEGLNRWLKDLMCSRTQGSLFSFMVKLSGPPMKVLSREAVRETDPAPKINKVMEQHASILFKNWDDVCFECPEDYFNSKKTTGGSSKKCRVECHDEVFLGQPPRKVYLFNYGLPEGEKKFTEADEFFGFDYEDFAKLHEVYSKICTVILSGPADPMLKPDRGGFCSCEVYRTSAVCSHLLACGLKRNEWSSPALVEVPPRTNKGIYGNCSALGEIFKL